MNIEDGYIDHGDETNDLVDALCSDRDLLLSFLFSKKSFMMTKKLYLLSGKTLRERISMWVLDLAGEKDSFKSDMNREELSDYLGTTRPSLSRELMAMQDEGLIEVERSSFKIKDREGLEYYAE